MTGTFGRAGSPAASEGPRLGVDLSGTFLGAARPGGNDTGGRAIQRYVDAGVRWFDCGEGASVAAIELRVGPVLSRPPAGGPVQLSTTLIGEPGVPDRSRPWSAGHVAPLLSGAPSEVPREIEEAVDRAARRLAGARIGTAWLGAGTLRSLREPSARRVLDEMTGPGGPIDAWGIRFDAAPADPGAIELALDLRPPRLALPVHLLNAAESLPRVREAAAAGIEVVAVDPFAGGRLDGRWLESLVRPSSAGQSLPPSWASVRDAFEPVRRLAFLTTDGRRTLPAAALQFLWGTPGISATLVRPKDPAELATMLSARASVPLTDGERARVEGRPPSTGAGPTAHGASLK